jgi:hypothetical protein
MTFDEVDRTLKAADVVIRGRVLEVSTESYRADTVPPYIHRLSGTISFETIWIKVEDVLAGWYFGSTIQVISTDQFSHLKCKSGDEVIVCALYSPRGHNFLLDDECILVWGEKLLWWVASPSAIGPFAYNIDEIKTLTARRRVMK